MKLRNKSDILVRGLLPVMIALLVGWGSSVTNAFEQLTTTTSENQLKPLSITFNIKQLTFSWNAITDVDHYKLFVSSNGSSNFTQIDGDVVGTYKKLAIPVHLTDWATSSYYIEAYDWEGKVIDRSEPTSINHGMLSAIGYFKASNTGPGDRFGSRVALSADGATMAISAQYEDSNATGIGSDAYAQAGNRARDAGAVYLFSRDSNDSWYQQAYVKAANTEADDEFGSSVALSADGTTLAVGAQFEDSSTTGVRGDKDVQADNTARNSGAVYLFSRDNNNSWHQQSYIKASNADAVDAFGSGVALSADGATLAVGAPQESSSATGVENDEQAQADNSASGAGAVYLFSRNGNNIWSQQAYIKASNTDVGDFFGGSVALNADGAILAVSALGESSSASGVGNDRHAQADNRASDAGAVYLYSRDSDDSWRQQAYIKASNTEQSDWFGWSIALSADGTTLAVGAVGEDSNSTGVGGDEHAQANNRASSAGAVYLFSRYGDDDSWYQQAYVKASNAERRDGFGRSVALSAEGSILVVGADGEDSSATGVGGDEHADIGGLLSGAVYLFNRNLKSTWRQQAYIKAPNSRIGGAMLGSSLALSADGSTLAVGAEGENSSTTGIGGNQQAQGAKNAGAVFLY